MTGSVLVAGAGGFIGGHLVGRLLGLGKRVVAVDYKPIDEWHQRWETRNEVADLRDPDQCERLVRGISQIFHLAAQAGGIGYITRNDWSCASSSVTITVNVLRAAVGHGVESFVYTSSACAYPTSAQAENAVPLREHLAMPAAPEGGYGWEKLFSEQLCSYAAAMSGLDVRVARLFNVYGPYSDWRGDRAKAPAAICRKIAQASQSNRRDLEVWGDGSQLRSFLYVTDCVDGLLSLVQSGETRPVNLASRQVVSIRQLATLVADTAGIDVRLQFLPTEPTGVRARLPDITRAQHLGWSPIVPLVDGVRVTYEWIYNQLRSTDETGGSAPRRRAHRPRLDGMERNGPSPDRRTAAGSAPAKLGGR